MSDSKLPSRWSQHFFLACAGLAARGVDISGGVVSGLARFPGPRAKFDFRVVVSAQTNESGRHDWCGVDTTGKRNDINGEVSPESFVSEFGEYIKCEDKDGEIVMSICNIDVIVEAQT